jgi:hypothetical protein
MKPASIITAIGATVLAIALTASAHDSDADLEAHHGGWLSLTGAWMVDVTNVDCVNGAPTTQPTFKALEGFELGGGYVQYGVAFGNRRTTGIGTWERTGRDAFESTVTFVRLDDATGLMPIAIVKIDDKLKMTSANDVTITSHATFTTMDGVVLSKGCANSVGVRL